MAGDDRRHASCEEGAGKLHDLHAATKFSVLGAPSGVDVRVMAAVPLDPATAGLDETEIARAAAFHFERDRASYVCAHGLLRHCISARLSGSPSRWRFSPGPFGKPMLDAPISLSVNLSHTNGWSACALSAEYAVGIDIETLRPDLDDPQLHRSVLTARECRDVVAAGDRAAQDWRFLQYWTLKEAVLKGLGCGFSMPPGEIEITPADDGLWRVETALLSPAPDLWRIAACRVGGSAALAVAWGPPKDKVNISGSAVI